MTMTRMDVPIGTVLDYAGASVPAGYLECDGSAVSRTAYPRLFAAIGTAWGPGDGSTTFNLPDFRGRTAIGAGAGTADGATSHSVGNSGGSETHTLTTSEIPSHKHSVGAHKHTVPQHGHGNNISFSVNSSGYIAGGVPGNGGHTHGYNNGSNNVLGEGSASSGSWSAKLQTAGASYVVKWMSDAGWHTHDLPNHTHSLTKSGGVSDKAAFDTNNSTAFDSGAAGGGSAHSIMQPYAVVRKVIRAA